MKFWRFLRKALVALLNLDSALEAFYKRDSLLGELNSAVDELSSLQRRLADFNLRRQLFLQFVKLELPTRREDLEDFFSERKLVATNYELIRIGGLGDGGYLVPNDLEGITSVFSPGVDQSSTFELFFANRGVPCYLADGSVESTPISHTNFKFTKRFLHQGNTSESWLNFDEWVIANSALDGNSLLQMDIEGGEWQILSNIRLDVLRSFRIIVVEYHGLHQLAYATAFETIRKVMDLLETHFDLVHLHPNNAESTQNLAGFEVPSLLEATYIRKDRVTTRTQTLENGHPLDSDNVQDLPPVSLGAFQKFKDFKN